MIRHNFIWNLLGLGGPLIAAVFTVPRLVSGLGEDRFGMLTLVWAVVSYFSLFDLGLGRTLTKELSVVLAKQRNEEIGPLVTTSSAMMTMLGCLGGLVLALGIPYASNAIHTSIPHDEVRSSLWVLAFTMPAIVLTSAFRGILESLNEFKLLNIIRVPSSLFTFVGPYILLRLGTTDLFSITLLLSIGRAVTTLVYGIYSWKRLPKDSGDFRFETKLLRPLGITGGWLTLSNIISPMMGYADRFLIGTCVSAVAITYYTTPQELVTKLWIIPGALTGVLFPTFASEFAKNREKTWKLSNRAVMTIYLIILPLSMALSAFAYELLAWWLKPEIAQHSFRLLQVFAVGTLINCLAHIPFTLLQSAGFPRLTALTHLFEFPLFLPTLYFLTIRYGIEGAAFSWFLRILLDTSILFILNASVLHHKVSDYVSRNSVIALTAGLVAFGAGFIPSLPVRFLFTLLVSGASLAALAKHGLGQDDSSVATDQASTQYPAE